MGDGMESLWADGTAQAEKSGVDASPEFRWTCLVGARTNGENILRTPPHHQGFIEREKKSIKLTWHVGPKKSLLVHVVYVQIFFYVEN